MIDIKLNEYGDIEFDNNTIKLTSSSEIIVQLLYTTMKTVQGCWINSENVGSNVELLKGRLSQNSLSSEYASEIQRALSNHPYFKALNFTVTVLSVSLENFHIGITVSMLGFSNTIKVNIFPYANKIFFEGAEQSYQYVLETTKTKNMRNRGS